MLVSRRSASRSYQCDDSRLGRQSPLVLRLRHRVDNVYRYITLSCLSLVDDTLTLRALAGLSPDAHMQMAHQLAWYNRVGALRRHSTNLGYGDDPYVDRGTSNVGLIDVGPVRFCVLSFICLFPLTNR